MNIAVHSQSDQQPISSNQGVGKVIPAWIIWTQCVCFAILYSIWNYPLTNFLGDLCMIIGALLSVYILYINRSFFKTKQAIPFWLLICLLVWIVFHLVFLSNNYPLQLRELTSIWKRVVIAIIFALGFGMALVSSPSKKGYWVLFYLGMLMPALIFLAKYFLNTNAASWGVTVPEYLRLYTSHSESPFYMYKTDYVSFCLPALALSLAQLKQNLNDGRIYVVSTIVYIIGTLAIMCVFYLGNIKNGVVYSVILFLAFVALNLNAEFNKIFSRRSLGVTLKAWMLKLTLIIALPLAAFPIVNHHIEQNPSWKSLWADSKVAIQVDQIDAWKYWGAKGYPLNEDGVEVSGTNYDRIAWGVVGLRLLQQSPLGYGLAQDSFGYLVKRNWPDARLTQTHSGWLDLALGLGIPGIGLLLTAFLMVMRCTAKKAYKRKKNQQEIWSSSLIWVLWALLLLWCTSEISIKTHIIALLFWVSFGTGLTALKLPHSP
jgi:hypothetical protein